MQWNGRVVTVFGGSGFIGTYIVKKLAERGCTVKVVSRDPERAAFLKTAGTVGQVVTVRGDITDEAALPGLIGHADIVINLTGILYPSGRQSFSAVHAQGAERLAKAAAAAGVSRLLHMSALGVERASKSRYAKTKLNGEKAVLAAFPGATIFRPSVVFGPEDHFFNLFASIGQYAPFLPLIGGGGTKFQPVYAGDVADAFIAAIERPASIGQIYELGGPEVMTFRNVLDFIRDVTGHSFGYLHLPFPIAGAIGKCLEILPAPPLTYDQVTLLHYDNITQPGAPGFAELGITPTAVESIVPAYLQRFRKGGQYARDNVRRTVRP